MAKKQTPTDLTVEPVDTDPVTCCGKDECTNCPFDESAIEPDLATSKTVRTYLAEDGDTYASIASKFKLEHENNHELATRLFMLNSGKIIVAGTTIQL
jgi:hypothetical protein